MPFFERLRQGLAQTRSDLLRSLGLSPSLSPEQEAEFEEALLKADLGGQLSARILGELKKRRGLSPREALESALLELCPLPDQAFYTSTKLALCEVTLLLGVNGSGKTTSCGKIAAHWKARGEKVLLVAADTFRAAAVEQLEIWAKRTQSDFFSRGQGVDPSSVVFDGVSKGRAGSFDRVIIDTAGRLQSKGPLMEELSKLRRVCAKALEGAPHRAYLVLDGSSGQNMLSQARLFNEAVPLNGFVVTKLDGTSKAGAVLSIMDELKLPVVLLGVGEAAEDLEEFKREDFVRALVGE